MRRSLTSSDDRPEVTKKALDQLGLENLSQFHDLTDRLCNLLGNPVTIEATDFELIAYSRQEEAVDEIRKLTVLQRRVPEPVVRELFRSGVVDRITSSQQPVRVHGLARVGLGNRVAVAIRLGDRVFGHIWVQEIHRILTDDDMLLLQHVANLAVTAFLQLEKQRHSHSQRVSDFLWGLVKAPQIGEEEAILRADQQQIQLPEPYRIVIIEPDKGVDPFNGHGNGEVSRFRQELLAVINDEAMRYRISTLMVRQEANITLLTSVSADESGPGTSAETYLRAIRNRAQRQGIPVSVSGSGIYHKISMLPMAYAEALRCLNVGRQLGWTGSVATKGNLGALQLLPLIQETDDKWGVSQGIHSKIARLIEEDERPGRNFPLLETLEVYLDCAGDTQRTAERLFVHVNTVNYRLRRITECAGLQLSDGLERLCIHMELKLRRLAGVRMGHQ